MPCPSLNHFWISVDNQAPVGGTGLHKEPNPSPTVPLQPVTKEVDPALLLAQPLVVRALIEASGINGQHGCLKGGL